MGNKKRYNGAFKLEVVELTRQPGKTVAGVAKEMGVPWKTVAGWVNRYNKRGPSALLGEGSGGYVRSEKANLSPEQAEIQLLKKEVEILRQEREILEKATAFFVKESR
jgi:transposase